MRQSIYPLQIMAAASGKTRSSHSSPGPPPPGVRRPCRPALLRVWAPTVRAPGDRKSVAALHVRPPGTLLLAHDHPCAGGESLYLPPIRSQPPRLSSPGPDCRHGPRRSLPCPNAPTRPAIRVLPHLKLLRTVIGCSDSVYPPPDLALPGSQLHGRLASITLPSERFAPLQCAAALTSPWAARRRQRPTSLTSQGHACQGEH